MRFLCPITALSLILSPLAAQQFIETFPIDGPTVPGWTVQNGAWQVLGGRLSETSGGTWAYVTKDGLAAQNCVLDGEFFYSTTSTIQFGGLSARYAGPGDTNTLMCKIQNNGGVADFDRVFLYERSGAGGNTYIDLVPGTLAAYCRMFVLNNEFWMEIDGDQDGIFEFATPRRVATTILASGLLGMNAYQSTEMDNFEYHDAVLVPVANSLPQIGTNYDLDLHVNPNDLWLGALSAGNAGIPFFVEPRAIPLTADGIFFATLGSAGLGLAGVADPAGLATISIPIPNNRVLVGFTLFTSAFTIDGQRVYGVGGISNEQAFTIQP